MKLFSFVLTALILFGPIFSVADACYPSKYGSEDTLGAVNNFSAGGVVNAARLIETGKVYSLAMPTGPKTPAFGERNAGEVGILEAGRQADILIVDGDPLADISLLQDKSWIRDVFIAGEPVALEINDTIKPVPLETSYRMWNEVYTEKRVAELRGHKPAVLHAV